MEESNVFDLLADAYQSISRVNEILRYAVRKFNLPTSTIRKSIKASKVLTALIGDGVISGDKDLCSLFFSTVKKNKQHIIVIYTDTVISRLRVLILQFFVFRPLK